MTISNPHHSFDIVLAETYGVEEAIMIHHFQHWIRINRNLKRNFKDGKWWTYQTREEIAAHFPYWDKDKVRRLTDKLLDEGVLIKGCQGFNKSNLDRTLWYAFADEARFVPNSKNVCEMANLPTGDDEFANPSGKFASSNHILKPDPITDSQSSSSSSLRSSSSDFKKEMVGVMKELIQATEEEFEEAWNKFQFLDEDKIPHKKAWFKKVIESAREDKNRQIVNGPLDVDQRKREYAIANRKIAEQKERQFPKSKDENRYILCLNEVVRMVVGSHVKEVRYDVNPFEWQERTGWN